MILHNSPQPQSQVTTNPRSTGPELAAMNTTPTTSALQPKHNEPALPPADFACQSQNQGMTSREAAYRFVSICCTCRRLKRALQPPSASRFLPSLISSSAARHAARVRHPERLGSCPRVPRSRELHDLPTHPNRVPAGRGILLADRRSIPETQLRYTQARSAGPSVPVRRGGERATR